MNKKVKLGGERLGSGSKMTEVMKEYGTTKHDLGYTWNTSMTTGTIVPFLVEVMTNGDYCDIDMDSIIRTHPTVGALFGSFKFQVDIFKCPIRHYNKLLHNNRKGIGMEMQNVFMPQIHVVGKALKEWSESQNPNAQQINTSSLLHYLGISGLGREIEAEQNRTERHFNAIPLLAYWDIYANYYANKSEKLGVVISPSELTYTAITDAAYYTGAMWLPRPIGLIAAADYNNVQEMKEYSIGDNKENSAYVQLVGTSMIKNNIKVWCKYYVTGVGWSALEQVSLSDAKFDVQINSSNTEIKIFKNPNTGYFKVVIMQEDPAYGAISVEENIEGAYSNKIKLTQFPLKLIDDMRDKILSHNGNSMLSIDRNATYPYKSSLGADQIVLENGEIEWMSHSKATMAGLGIKTYQSDRFNNWVNTDWIEGGNGVNELSAIDVSDGKLTMDSLNLQQKIYNVLNNIALSGGSYRDWQEAVYSRRGVGDLEVPEWMGGMSSEIVFDEVVSTAAANTSETEPLGTIGGRGKQTNMNKHNVRITANEPLFILGVVSITPRISYSQGNRWYNRLKTMNDLHKPELDAISFQDLLTEEFAAFDTQVHDGNEVYNSIGKQVAWQEYTTNVNRTHGNFAAGENESYMVLDRRYQANEDVGDLADATTYIDPQKYSNAFALTKLDEQHFWVNMGVKIDMTRVMSSKLIPQL